ncbi:MAG: hypothetical protein A3D31_12655 [Candidatus Fluviicola riflensis]|nr:MAG: hypothetical protein CHH17_17095 [Candidatus Fluviicola riflensis]OGS77834.1 MAG: hypothetical protein A3D31_12655 [Candidatus Fluviicola riflensis]OGS84899.1 MAG: hypothetical protein A2724_09590 [Fluviicola sp. RIFCSPHIGHO2_01_FULL_43_53]OGS89171.1 MAG: hypothetical protein A3E30_03895 [Fluviicola sp. RIFCSPHIGHO2_12_FULL_43_24]
MEVISIEINGRRKAYAVRELFNKAFPNLKLEFYAKPHTKDGPHSEKIVTSSRLTIADCRTVDHNGMLVIEPGMTTTELKNHLRDTFGLKGEVFKWNGASWQPVDSGKQSLENLNKLNGPIL